MHVILPASPTIGSAHVLTLLSTLFMTSGETARSKQHGKGPSCFEHETKAEAVMLIRQVDKRHCTTQGNFDTGFTETLANPYFKNDNLPLCI